MHDGMLLVKFILSICPIYRFNGIGVLLYVCSLMDVPQAGH